MADPTDINKSDDQKQVDYLETPRQPEEEYAEFNAAKQREKFFGGGGQEKLQGSGIIAGAVIRRDGTLDTSHATKILETPEQAQRRRANEEKHRAERLRQRQEKFAIPENVKPNSSEHVWYELRNAAQIARENVDKPITPDDQRWDYKQRDREYKKMQQFKLEQRILEDLSLGEYRQAWEKDMDDWKKDQARGKQHVGQLKGRYDYPREFPPAATATEQLDTLEERWEEMVDKSPGAQYDLLSKYTGYGNLFSVKDILSVLPDLRNRLAVAAVASK